jgi:hypothetical protein
VWQREAIRGGAKLLKNRGKFVKHVVPAVVKPIHSLWNQVIGFFFLCFAAIFEIGAFRYYKAYLQDPPAEKLNDLGRIVAVVMVGIVLAAFGISAFLKARRISRS